MVGTGSAAAWWRRAGLAAAVFGVAAACGPGPATLEERAAARARLEHRWLFVWRDMRDAREVDRMIARFDAAKAAGYNAVAFPYDVARDRGPALKAAAARSGLDLIAIVMGGPRDRNDVEGVLVEDARFVAGAGTAAFEPDARTRLLNGGFEVASGDRLAGWTLQDRVGRTTFVDRGVAREGGAALRMGGIAAAGAPHSRVMQRLTLAPHRQYRISFWVKTEQLEPARAEVRVLGAGGRPISFQNVRVRPSQDWTHYDIVFNSFGERSAYFYLGTWSSAQGTLWWDDVRVEAIALVNVLRRPGCPVAVRGEHGETYEEGRDFAPIVDPRLNPWEPYHEPPVLTLPAGTRIRPGERLRVSYYHPIIAEEDRLTVCLSEPRVFEQWRAEVEYAGDLYQPRAFLMSHDEFRVVNQCARCRSQGMTPGALVAWNVRRAAAIIREVRPGAAIWVWNDMFDPFHNALDRYYAVNGSLRGSWEGLDPDVGIVNWNSGAARRSARFFAEQGLRQILAGYYDADADGAGIAAWIDGTRDLPGIAGAMYTTWEDRYDAMAVWAGRAWR